MPPFEGVQSYGGPTDPSRAFSEPRNPKPRLAVSELRERKPQAPMEDMLRKQLAAAIGKEVSPADFAAYMRPSSGVHSCPQNQKLEPWTLRFQSPLSCHQALNCPCYSSKWRGFGGCDPQVMRQVGGKVFCRAAGLGFGIGFLDFGAQCGL